MKFAKELYAGEIAGQIKENMVRELERGIFKEGYFVIALPENGHDLLEALPVSQSGNRMFGSMKRPDGPRVVGLAVTNREAKSLLVRIIMDVYRKTGGFEPERYFHF